MTDELETRLRDHYRRAAQEILPDPALIRRAQAAPRTTRRVVRWGVPAVAAALTAVAATVAAVLWPQPSVPPRPAERPPGIENSHPVPPTSPSSRGPTRDPSSPEPSHGSTPTGGSKINTPGASTGPTPTRTPHPSGSPGTSGTPTLRSPGGVPSP